MSVRDLIILGCSSQQPTRFRNHGAYLLRWNNEGHLFDPGEGTQRQFIFANVAPTVVTRIYISHFHGDHCLGLPSMLMRLNLDKVTHPIHCYYPASGKKYFDRLRNSTIYHETIHVVEHPVSEEGIVHDDGKFIVEAYFLKHGVETIGWRITEPTTRKFDKNKITELKLRGEAMRTLVAKGQIDLEGELITLDQISHFREGDTFAYVADTVECPKAYIVAQGAKLLLSESTYLDEHAHLAKKHHHLTASQAAKIAQKSGVDHLVLTHFSARYPDARAHAKEAQAIHSNTTAAHDLKTIQFNK